MCNGVDRNRALLFTTKTARPKPEILMSPVYPPRGSVNSESFYFPPSACKMTYNWKPAREVMKRLQIPGLALFAVTCTSLGQAAPAPTSTNPHAAAAPMLKQYCAGCHGKAATAGINLEQMTASPMADSTFSQWQRVVAVLEEKRMPPAKMPQPSDADRAAAATSIRASLKSYAEKNAGDPGAVTVRRLTSAEYGYTVRDLTGLDLDFSGEFAGDSVGGEGFSNFGDVQFLQDSNLERYLESAKKIADHAVVGAGPIEFYEHTGKTGFELSAINRIKDIYAQYGFRTVSGEGGSPFGLEKYTKAFFVAWEFQHRASLGQPQATLVDFANKEGITPRFAQHIWKVTHQQGLLYPSSEVVARWNKIVSSTKDPATARAECEKLKDFVTTWPLWLFARGDVAAGGQGDESPLIINDETLKAIPSKRLTFALNPRRPSTEVIKDENAKRTPPPAGPMKVYMKVDPVNPQAGKQPVIIWRNAVVGTRVFNAAAAAAAAAGDGAKKLELKDVKPL